MKLSISVKPNYRAKPMHAEIEEIEFDESNDSFTVTCTLEDDYAIHTATGYGWSLEEALRSAGKELREVLEEGFEKA
jgi:hypothetical protein